ncbi:hypothetical protein [Mycobacterium intracellulare]|uniref:hypothetical protein n=1 Tax=Mycobacterium intracellulare TaxID=1767 RepID=UPI00109EC50E|nr:hypothetical protein [Mycobacterium intracellulare]
MVVGVSCGGTQHADHNGGASTAASPATTSANGHPAAPGDHHEHSGRGVTDVQDGYHLALLGAPTAAGGPGGLSFRITGPTGAAQTRFQLEQERLMHVYVVRADLTDFYHIHPDMAPDGTWSVPLTLSRPGPYHVVTEFVALDEQNQPHHLMLGANVVLPGQYSPEQLPGPSQETNVDGYTVRVEGTPVADQATMLTLKITKGGAPVTDIEPYLGVYAHLTAFHEGDLQAVHIHPHNEPSGNQGSPPELMVHTEFPAAGLYRMFIQFQTGGQLHTAAITVQAQ